VLAGLDAGQARLGAGNDIGRVDDDIYWRLAYLKDLNTHAFSSAGRFQFDASRKESTADGQSLSDLGADAGTNTGHGMHNFAAYASYVREDQTRDD